MLSFHFPVRLHILFKAQQCVKFVFDEHRIPYIYLMMFSVNTLGLNVYHKLLDLLN